MKENSAKYFSNQSCAYYPCHRITDGKDFNCLFCYCPLYALGDRCGGNFDYNDKGLKDCSGCTLPHGEGGYEYVMAHIKEVCEIARLSGKTNPPKTTQ